MLQHQIRFIEKKSTALAAKTSKSDSEEVKQLKGEEHCRHEVANLKQSLKEAEKRAESAEKKAQRAEKKVVELQASIDALEEEVGFERQRRIRLEGEVEGYSQDYCKERGIRNTRRWRFT